jgi:hypothetical protein
MSEKKKKNCPYEQVTGKLDTIDINLLKAQKEIADLVNVLMNKIQRKRYKMRSTIIL